MTSPTAQPSPPPVDRLDLWVAVGSALLIAAHLALRLGSGASSAVTQPPLAVTLIAGGGPLLGRLLEKLARRRFDADLLAGISIVTAAVVDEWLAGAIVVLMLSGGATLESFAVRRASSALHALASRMPSTAHRKAAGGEVRDVPVGDVRAGDVLVIYPHEVCPVDGEVIDGGGRMDESFVTGEAFPLAKAPGASVISGAVNGDAPLSVGVARPARESRYAQLMRFMQRAEDDRPRLRRLADRLGAWYTPAALAVAIAAWLLTGRPERFLSVLVVATPCPLLIAVPVAIIGAISLCARRSIVVKDPAALERAATCRVAIFDKTGTLTCGRPALTEQFAAPGLDPTTILGLAASLERYSRHPLARAVVARAQIAGAAVRDAVEVSEPPGRGLRGIVDGRHVELTSRRALPARAAAALPPNPGGLECVVLVDGEYAATYRFRDEPRPETAAFVAHLRPRHGIRRVLIVSGDRESEVRYFADRLGLTEVFAERTPEQKVEIVRGETARARTLYVGDGINDAPALASATVGVAIAGGGGDVAAAAADVVILGNSLAKVDEFLHVGRRMRAVALQSAIGGIALSLAGMAAAALGWLTPVQGAVAQEAIDLLAVLNALRVALPPRLLTDFATPREVPPRLDAAPTDDDIAARRAIAAARSIGLDETGVPLRDFDSGDRAAVRRA